MFYTENKHKTVQGKDQSTKVWLSNYHNLTFFGNLNAHAADSPRLVYRKRWTLRKQHPLLMHLCQSNRRRITAVLVKPAWRPWRYFCSTHVKLKPSEKRPFSRSRGPFGSTKKYLQQTSVSNRRPPLSPSASPASLLTLAGCLADPLSCYVAISNCLDLLELTEVARPWRKG